MNKYKIPKEKPEYHFVKSNKKKKSKIYLALDRLLTVYGFLLVFAYAIILLLSSFQFKLSSIALFIIFWLMLTYIAFPRLHSFFATMYLPDYFLSRTKTGDGILGDPVNMAILGSEKDIHSAMRRAGWTKADPITLRSSLGIALSTVTHKSYPEAPVSDLYLFGRKQNFAYQMEVNGSATRRHHVRFWKVPEGWNLPGGNKVEWLAAGTFDKGVGLSSATLQVTHKIDKEVDKERDFIIETMLYADKDISVDIIEEYVIPYCDENGGGDSIETDGNMPIVNVNGAYERATKSGVEIEQKSSLEIPKDNEALNKELPPKSLLYIGAFVIFKLVVATISFVGLLAVISYSNNMENVPELAVLLILIIDGLISLVLYIFTLKKFKWSRIIFLIIASLSCTAELVHLAMNLDSGFFKIVSNVVSIAIVLALSSPDIRQWVYTIERRGE